MDKHVRPIIEGQRRPRRNDRDPAQPTLPRPAERPRSTLIGTLLVAVALVALALLAFLVLVPRVQPYRVTSFSAARVEPARLTETVSANGQVVSSKTVDLRVAISGTLRRFAVAEGSDVQAGQVVAELESAEVRDRLARARIAERDAALALEQAKLGDDRTATAQRALERAVSARDVAQRALEDARQLYAVGGESLANVEIARTAVDAASSDVRFATAERDRAREVAALQTRSLAAALEAARTEVAAAQANTSALALRATMAGRVVSLGLELGQAVAPGTSVLTVASVQQLGVTAQVEERAASRVVVGQQAVIGVSGRNVQGRVVGVASRVQKRNGDGVVEVKLAFSEPTSALLPNASASVDIRVRDRANVLSVPRGPFLASGGERFVYVLNAENTGAVRREVEFGASDARRVEVLSGLRAGERVIMTDYEAYKDQPTVAVAAGGEIK